MPTASWRSTSVTSWPALRRYQAEATPARPAPRTSTCIRSVEGESLLHRHLPVRDFSLLDLAARVHHLEPSQVMHRLRRLGDRIADGFLEPLGRGAGELDRLVDMVRHCALLVELP